MNYHKNHTSCSFTRQINDSQSSKPSPNCIYETCTVAQ